MNILFYGNIYSNTDNSLSLLQFYKPVKLHEFVILPKFYEESPHPKLTHIQSCTTPDVFSIEIFARQKSCCNFTKISNFQKVDVTNNEACIVLDSTVKKIIKKNIY
jgi:hypothetical protein